MLNENLIANLEQSLRQTRNQQNRLIQQLREAEAQADTLRGEIAALENSAAQTGEAIYSILATMGTSSQSWGFSKQGQHQQQQFEEDDYNLDIELKRNSRANQNNQNFNHSPNNHKNQNSQNNQNNHNSQNNGAPPVNNYRNNSVAYINNPRGGGNQNNSNVEPISNRFSDRTITQACTLLLREASSPLHVNELYNLLVSGGFEFKGNNPTISIAVSLNRNRRFRKVAPGTFELLMRDASQAAS